MARINKIALTKKQKAVYDWIAAYVRRHGSWPTFRDVQAGLDFKSVNSATQAIKSLQKKGWIEKTGSYYDFPKEDMHHLSLQRMKKMETVLMESLMSRGLSEEDAKQVASEMFDAVLKKAT